MECPNTDETGKIILSAVLTLIFSAILSIAERLYEWCNDKKQHYRDIYNNSVNAEILCVPVLEIITTNAISNLQLFENLSQTPFIDEDDNGGFSWNFSINQPQQMSMDGALISDILPVYLRAEYYVLQGEVNSLNMTAMDFHTFYRRIVDISYNDNNIFTTSKSLRNCTGRDIKTISNELIQAYCRVLLQVIRIQSVQLLSNEYITKKHKHPTKIMSYRAMKRLVDDLTEYKPSNKEISSKIRTQKKSLEKRASKNVPRKIQCLLLKSWKMGREEKADKRGEIDQTEAK